MKSSLMFVVLFMSAFNVAHAQNGIDKTITDLEIRDIQNGNLPQLKDVLQKGTGKSIRVNLDIPSVKKAGAIAADDLRTLSFRLGEAFHNEFEKTPAFKESVKTKVDEVVLQYSAKGKPQFIYNKKSRILTLAAPFGATNWDEFGPLAEQVKKALK